jgi:predicted PurR-regulated permease PerM
MNNLELVVNLFENHLNTISLILAIVSVVFVILGIVSYKQIMKHIKATIDTIITDKIQKELDDSNIRDIIEEELNKKIENYHVIINDSNEQMTKL